MPGFRLAYAAATGQFQKAIDADLKTIAAAATGAIRDAGEMVKQQGRANIASAGFSRRWQNTLRVNLYPDRGVTSLHPVALAFHKIPYAGIFENGGTIAGSPLLWLPLPDVPPSVMGRHMSPANFVRLVGPLHTIFRPGKPPLLAAYMAATAANAKITVAKLVAGSRAVQRRRPGSPAPKVVSVPLFFGINKVFLRKRFDLTPIFNKAKDSLGELYVKNLKV